MVEGIVIPKRIVKLIEHVLKGAVNRQDVLPHMLFVGPPGSGKTTLATYIATSMGTSMVRIIGSAISRPKDIISVLIKISDGTILFIDEIHRLSPSIEEILYPAMDRFEIDVLVGSGKVKHLMLSPFTLIGATTMESKISPPLRSRFSIVVHLDQYERDDLLEMINLYSGKLSFTVDAKEYLIKLSRFNPRRLNLLIERVKDFATAQNLVLVTKEDIEMLLEIIDYDKEFGLDSRERKYIYILANMFDGGPVGLRSIASALGESVSTVQDIIEPSLITGGFVKLTSRGRQLTPKGWDVLKQ